MQIYKTLLSQKTYQRVELYLDNLKAGGLAGSYLQQKLAREDLAELTVPGLLELLVGTKIPQIFAESAVIGNGSDWNHIELGLLGDIAIAAPVTVFDNGRHSNPTIHESPFAAMLLFVPGALLRNGQQHTPADWAVVAADGSIDQEAYYQLYERRLLPSFLYTNEQMKRRGKRAFITVPGLGCGQFAGPFQGRLGVELKQMLHRLLVEHGAALSHIRAVYYDPYQECQNERWAIEGIDFLVRPLTHGNETKPQLCQPTAYEEAGDDFSACELVSVVAWDHVSWPGNDFYQGARATDDGVKAAATNINGRHDRHPWQLQSPNSSLRSAIWLPQLA